MAKILPDCLDLTYMEPIVVDESANGGALTLTTGLTVARKVTQQVFGGQRL